MSDESAPIADGDATAPGGHRRSLVLLGAAAALATVGVAGAVAWNVARSSAQAGDTPRFVDVTAESGIDHAYTGDFEYFVGGGVAALDCDVDGRPDLFVAGGERPAALYRNASRIGTLRFERLESSVTDLEAVTGAYPIDVDSDGATDLVVLRRGANVVLRGLGECRFEDATARLGIDGGEAWTTAFSATWESTNSLPTLAFGAYLDLDRDGCGTSQLVRPAPGGSGYAAPVPLPPGYCTLSVLFSDWDRSGRRDLRLSNDRHYDPDGKEQLWHIADGEPPREYTEADGWRPLTIWGMGIASEDLDGDGYPEVFLTSQGDNKLQTLAEGSERPTYEDIALASGVTAQRPYTGGDVLPSTAWHPEFDDVNNDGWVDLFVSKGNVEAQVDYAARDPNNLLLGRADGTFEEAGEAAGIADDERSRGAAVIDLDLDGMLDLVVVNRQAPMTVWHNVGADGEGVGSLGHWLAIDLAQPAPNVDAVGSWVEIRAGGRTSVREVTVGGGHAGGSSGWIHAGLGSADEAEVRVQWPDGEFGPWIPVTADRFVTIERGANVARSWSPPG